MKDLIGRKVKGFRFENGKYYHLNYNESMENHVGEVGDIASYQDHNKSYRVNFNTGSWFYPASEIEAHLVDEWVVGQEYEFPVGLEWEKRVLLAILPEECSGRYIVKSNISGTGWTYKSKIRHIDQPNKEILDQIKVLEKELENLKSKVK